MLAPMIRIVWLIRTLPVTTFGKELIELETPRLRVLFSSPPQTSHILELKDGDYEDSQSLCPDGSVNNTEFQDSLHEFTPSPSIEDNVLIIGD